MPSVLGKPFFALIQSLMPQRPSAFALSARALRPLRRVLAALLIGTLLGPVAAPLMARQSSPAPVDISGTWSDSAGQTFTLFQDGSHAWGVRSGTYTIDATVSGNQVTGVQKDSAGSVAFNFVWTVAADGGNWSGAFGLGNDTPSTGWSGSKVPGVNVSAGPAVAIVKVGTSRAYSAWVAGSTDKRVTWSTSAGSVDAAGTFTAPATEGLCTLTATSVADPAKSATATALVTLDGTFDVSGTFTTNYGDLALTQNGTQVTGAWSETRYGTGTQATLTGTMSGTTLSGTFTLTGWTRAFSINFAPDRKTFSGSFTGYWGEGNGWSGTRKPVSVNVDQGTFVSVKVGATKAFTATVVNATDKHVTWSATGGSVDETGLFTAPATEGTWTVTATSVEDPTKSATVQVAVTQDGTFNVAGSYATNYGTLTLSQSGSQVTGNWAETRYGTGTLAPVTGTLNGATVSGTFTLTGWTRNFSITFSPDRSSFSGSFTGYWGDGNAWNGTRNVTGVSVRLNPSAGQTLLSGSTLAYNAEVSGAANSAVTWSATGGAVTSAGVYTAPDDAGTYTVTATSVEDPSKSGSGTVTVPFSVIVTPNTPTLGTGQQLRFVATLSGSANKAVIWSLPDANSGTITADGLYTAPASVPDAAGTTYHLVATSVANPAVSSTIAFTVRPTVQVTPGSAVVQLGQSLQLSATVTGLASPGVSWSATGGTVSASGLYSAPQTAGTYTVTATSTADPAFSASATITVPVQVRITTADPAWVGPGRMTVLRAEALGTSNQTFTWEVVEGSEGLLTAYAEPFEATNRVWNTQIDAGKDVAYQAPTHNGSATVRVRSKQDPSATALVHVLVQTAMIADPTDVTVEAGDTATFQASYLGAFTPTMSTVGAASGGSAVISSPEQLLDFEISGGEILPVDYTHTVMGYQVPPGCTTSDCLPPQDQTVRFGTPFRFKAPEVAGTYYITVISKQDPTARTTITVHVPFRILLTPDNAFVPNGGTLKLTATVKGSLNKAVDWSLWGGSADSGSIDADGTYHAPANLAGWGGTFVQARSQADPSKLANVTVLFGNPFVMSESALEVEPGAWRALAVSELGHGTTDVLWSATGGSITANGIYTAPTLAGEYVVTAQSKLDATRTATCAIHVPKRLYVSVSNGNPSIGQTVQCAAQVLGMANTAVTWSVTGGPGVIDAAGLYTAPASLEGNSAYVEVTAVSQEDPTLHASYGFRVHVPLLVQPNPATVRAGDTLNFLATGELTGSGVTWTTTGGGSFASTGAFTATGAAGDYTVTVTSVSDSSKFLTVPLKVRPKVSVTNATLDLVEGQSLPLTAQVLGLTDTSVTWATSLGTVTNGTLVVPAGTLLPQEAARTFTVQATSVADPTVSSDAVAATVHRRLHLWPAARTLSAGSTITFTPSLFGLQAQYLVWTATGGSITQAGVYTAPATAGTYTVAVADAQDPATRAEVTVTVPVEVTVTPGSTVLPVGYNRGFLVKVLGDPAQGITWSVKEQGGGSITQAGVYTPPTAAGTYTVVATSTLDATAKGEATVRVPVTVTIDPEQASVKPGESVRFKVLAVSGATNQAVVWSSEAGSIDATGLYTAPATAGTYKVTATSAADATAKATALVRVSTAGAVSVSLTPAEVTLHKGDSQSFTATVTGDANGAVTWSASAGSISESGTFTAPNSFGTYTVTATSVADPSASATATVIVQARAGEDRAFTYDENGNLTSDGERSFEWDAENRLVLVTKGAHQTEFVYDGMGRKARIVERDLVNGEWTTTSDKAYVYEGQGVAEERASDGITLLRRFEAHGFQDADGTLLYFTRDHQGSVRELVDSQQVVRARYDYDPYGRVTKLSGDKDSPFLYTGHWWHAQSGLYLTHFRQYDPALGRWISRDPSAEAGGVNLYAYVGNNPVRLIDPNGLYWSDPIGGWDWLQSWANFGAGIGHLFGFDYGDTEHLICRSSLAHRLGMMYGAGVTAAILFVEMGGVAIVRAVGALAEMGYAALSAESAVGLAGATGAAVGAANELEEVVPEIEAGVEAEVGTGVLNPGDAARIQNAADRTDQEITVVGSRARGDAGPASDWDYIMSGKSSQRHSAASSVPRGTNGGDITASGRENGINIFQSYNPNAPDYNPLDPTLPHITFRPRR